MVRIVGINVPVKKCVPFALTYIYGIGVTAANVICRDCEIDKRKRISDLQDEDIEKISGHIRQNFLIEGELRKKVAMEIKSLIEMGCYRGLRHRKGLPVRGQRTHTNAKTRKGRSRLPVAGKK